MDDEKKSRLTIEKSITLGDILAFACIASIVTKSAGYLIRAIKMPNGNKN